MILQSFVGWFNLATAIQVESRSPTGFILFAIREFSFLRHASSLPSLLFLWLHIAKQTILSLAYIKPTVQDQMVQIQSNSANTIEVYLPLWNLTVVLSTYLQKILQFPLFALQP